MVRFIVMAALVFLASAAAAEDFAQAITAAKKTWEDCALVSVAAQLKQQQGRDLSLISEQAFQACSTEERYVSGMSLAQGVPPPVVEQVVLSMRINLKRMVHDIANHPEKFGGQKRRDAR